MSVFFRHRIVVILSISIIIGSVTAWYAWYLGYWAPLTVRVGYLTADIHHLALFIAREKGWYLGTGIRFEFKEFPNGPTEMLAFAAGELDIGYLGIVPAMLHKVNMKVNITVVAAANTEGSALVVNPKKIASPKDLKGKMVATPGAGTVQDYLLSLIESNHNVAVERMFITPPAGMEPALQRGDVDGFIAWEPFPARSVYNGIGKILLTSHDVWPNHPCCVVVASSQFLKDHPDLVKTIVNIHVGATKFISENQDEAMSIAAKYTGQEKAVVKSASERVTFDHYPNKDRIKAVLLYLIEGGKIPKENVPKNIDGFLDGFINTKYIGA
ncbi:MAG: taurine transporter substrate binding subunit [Candidatus Bathyarchaeota archaeon BA1]|nr:MAG: taurine transporter substrate binding subunit [Candidatus Bathyarchaeota archaeon BA1]